MKWLLIFVFFANGLMAELICPITPEIPHGVDKPTKFNTSNNLRRITGSPYVALGKKVVVSGKIMDQNCVPIKGAEVSMWHFNAYGEYQYKDVDYKEAGIDKNFAGTGSTITDNLGRYHFITIFPGEYTTYTPVMHFSINHNDFLPFEVSVFFPGSKASELMQFDAGIRDLLIMNKVGVNRYEYDITLNGSTFYREY